MMMEVYKSDLCSAMGIYAWIGEKIGQKIQSRRKAGRK